MKFTEEKILDQGQGKWTVTIDGQQWGDILKKAKNRVHAAVEIPGFRKGKAPEKEIAKYVTPAKIYNEAFRIAFEPAFNFARDSEGEIKPMTNPQPIPVKVSEKEIVIDFVFDLFPSIEIGKYTGITTIEKTKPEVSKEEVEEVINQYQQRFAMEKNRDANEKIADGDVVIFDFKGFIDSEAFKGGEAKDHTLIIGSKNFIPGFETKMIGLGLGKTSIEVKFPEEYAPEFAGKDAMFELDIKEIKERILPAKDDELVKDLALKNVTTFAELEAKIKEDILNQKTTTLKNSFIDSLMEEIIKDSKVVLPKTAIDQEIQQLKTEFEEQVKRQGLTLKDYKKATGFSDTDIEHEMIGDAKLRLASYLVRNEIIAKEKFKIEENAIDNKLNELATMYGIEVEQIKGILPTEQIEKELVHETLINFLYEKNGK